MALRVICILREHLMTALGLGRALGLDLVLFGKITLCFPALYSV